MTYRAALGCADSLLRRRRDCCFLTASGGSDKLELFSPHPVSGWDHNSGNVSYDLLAFSWRVNCGGSVGYFSDLSYFIHLF